MKTVMVTCFLAGIVAFSYGSYLIAHWLGFLVTGCLLVGISLLIDKSLQ